MNNSAPPVSDAVLLHLAVDLFYEVIDAHRVAWNGADGEWRRDEHERVLAEWLFRPNRPRTAEVESAVRLRHDARDVAPDAEHKFVNERGAAGARELARAAAERDDVAALARLRAAGLPLDGTNLFAVACRHGARAAAEWLLRELPGLDPHYDGRALRAAARGAPVAMLEWLLALPGFDRAHAVGAARAACIAARRDTLALLRARFGDAPDALQYAATSGDVDFVARLADELASPPAERMHALIDAMLAPRHNRILRELSAVLDMLGA